MDFAVEAMGHPVLASPVVAGLAKALVVGGLMAGAAAGIYVVAPTQSSKDEPQVVAETTTVEPVETKTTHARTPR